MIQTSKRAAGTATLPARGDYAHLDATVQSLAQAYVDGTATEEDTRWAIAAALASSTAIEAAVNAWVARTSKDAHLREDLTNEATDWLIYRLTGHQVGEYMRQGQDVRELASLTEFAEGSSVAGFARKGVAMNMSKFRRTLSRHSTTHDDALLYDAITDQDSGLAPRVAAPAPDVELDQIRSEAILTWHASATTRASKARLVWANAEALCAALGVPAGARPLLPQHRRDTAEFLLRDPSAALRSLQAAVADNDTDPRAEALVPIWLHYSRTQMDAVLDCAQPEQAALTICLGALFDLPEINRPQVSHVRARLRELTDGHPAQLQAHRMLNRFLLQEFAGRDIAHAKVAYSTDTPWTQDAAQIAAAHPDLLGATVGEVRATLLALVPWAEATGTGLAHVA